MLCDGKREEGRMVVVYGRGTQAFLNGELPNVKFPQVSP